MDPPSRKVVFHRRVGRQVCVRGCRRAVRSGGFLRTQVLLAPAVSLQVSLRVHQALFRCPGHGYAGVATCRSPRTSPCLRPNLANVARVSRWGRTWQMLANARPSGGKVRPMSAGSVRIRTATWPNLAGFEITLARRSTE